MSGYRDTQTDKDTRISLADKTDYPVKRRLNVCD
jgi:hypothetical protein